ncbi:MAG: YvcK family protein [Candidatus Omnitrophica bacterium]|nr:YvcK family protein [Candidatus Omnitrophota bacterium]
MRTVRMKKLKIWITIFLLLSFTEHSLFNVSLPNSAEGYLLRRIKGESFSPTVVLKGLGFKDALELRVVKSIDSLASFKDGVIEISESLLNSDYLLLLETERVVNERKYAQEFRSSLNLTEQEIRALARAREVGRFLSLSPQQQEHTLEALRDIGTSEAQQLLVLFSRAKENGLGSVFGEIFAGMGSVRNREVFLKTNPNYRFFIERYGQGDEQRCREELEKILGRNITEDEFFRIVLGTVGRDALLRPSQIALIRHSARAPPSEKPDITVIGGSTWPNLLADKLRDEIQQNNGEVTRTITVVVSTTDDGGSSRIIQNMLRATDAYRVYIFSPGDAINDWKGFSEPAIQALMEIRFKGGRYKSMSFEEAVKEAIDQVESAYRGGFKVNVNGEEKILYLPKNWLEFVSDLLNVARHVDERFIATGILSLEGQSLRNLFYIGLLDYAGYLDAGVVKGGMERGKLIRGASLLAQARINKGFIDQANKLVANILGVGDMGWVVPSTHDEGVVVARLRNGNVVTEQTDISRPAPRNGREPSRVIGVDGNPVYNHDAFTNPSPIDHMEIWSPVRNPDGRETLLDEYNEDGSRKRKYQQVAGYFLQAVAETIEAIRNAQGAIFITCGSILTSVGANLVVKGIVEALRIKKAEGKVPIILSLKPLTSNEDWGMEEDGSHIIGVLSALEKSIQIALGDPSIKLSDFITHVVLFDTQDGSAITPTMATQIKSGMLQFPDGSFVLGEYSHLDRRPRGVMGVADNPDCLPQRLGQIGTEVIKHLEELTSSKDPQKPPQVIPGLWYTHLSAIKKACEVRSLRDLGVESKSEVEARIRARWGNLGIVYCSEIEEVIEDWRWYLPPTLHAKDLEYTYRFSLEAIWRLITGGI